MKLNCPSCSKSLNIPDKYAGKKVKCPSCEQPIRIPNAQPVPDAEADDGGFDLASLGDMESHGQAVVFERRGKPMTLKEAQAAQASKTAAEQTEKKPTDPRMRICPRCQKKVTSNDIYVDLICSHCGAPIPGQELASEEKARYLDSMANRMGKGVSFYAGFTGALIYPTRAITAIGLGAAIAVGTIAVPLLGILAFTQAGALNPLTADESKDSAAWVGMFLTVMFSVEAAYFGAVAFHVVIDAIRATTALNEQPPNLTWNVINLGAALGGYVALLFGYALVVLLMIGGVPTSADDFANLMKPLSLLILSLMTFSVPMNIIGLSSTTAMDGLHPVKVAKSIGKTIGHYFFLFLIVLIYLAINFGIMYGVMSWAGPKIEAAATRGLDAGFGNMLLGVLAWGIVIGSGFYFAY